MRAIQACFGFTLPDDPHNIRLKPELGGGALLDAGSYPLSLIRLVMGEAPESVMADASWGATGVDISVAMIERAREMNSDRATCEWAVNDTADLRAFADGEFDLVVSFIVLQHVPDRMAISSYLREMARILAPGGALVVQMPASMPLRQRVQWRRRAYHGLRAVRVPERTLYDRLGLDPIRMNWLPRRDVEAAIRLGGARVVSVQDGWLGDGSRVGREDNLTYIATRYH